MAVLERRQTGTVTLGVGVTTSSPGVLTYVPGRSLIIATQRGGTSSPGEALIQVTKTGAGTTLTFTRQSGVSGSVTIDWELLEFGPTVAIQDISWTVNATFGITPVTLARSFIVSAGYFNAGSIQTGDDTARYSFDDNDTARVSLAAGQNVDGGNFQVVDYNGAFVESFTRTALTTDTTYTQGLTNSFIMGQTMLFGSMMYPDVTDQLDFTEVFRLHLLSATQVQANRNSTSAFTQDHTIFVCGFNDWTVQRGNQAIAGGTTVQDVGLSPSVSAISNTLSKCVAAFGGLLSYCQSNDADDAYQENTVTALLTATNNLRLERTTSGPALTVSWEVGDHANSAGAGELWFHF